MHSAIVPCVDRTDVSIFSYRIQERLTVPSAASSWFVEWLVAGLLTPLSRTPPSLILMPSHSNRDPLSYILPVGTEISPRHNIRKNR
jgi:hypothetical protein